MEKNSRLKDFWRRFSRNKTALLGLIVIVILTLLAIFADVIADYQLMAIEQHPEIRLQGPSLEHLLGTDAFGRDIFARLVHGARYSLCFALVCTTVGILGGSLIGAVSAYLGGRWDTIIMRALDAVMCIPGTLLVLSMVSALGMGLKSIIIALSVTSIPSFARIMRSVVLNIVQQEYIEAAKACGIGDLRIIIGHVLPNAVGMIIINATMNIAGTILSASGLSYIGMGIQPPAPEWGAMLNESMNYMRMYPGLVIMPGLAIVITALSFNLLGDGLSEALDPRLKD